jgi:hypothetical protein
MSKKELKKLKNKVALALALEGINSVRDYATYFPFKCCDRCAKQPWARIGRLPQGTWHYCMYKNKTVIDENGEIHFSKSGYDIPVHSACLGWIMYPNKKKEK